MKISLVGKSIKVSCWVSMIFHRWYFLEEQLRVAENQSFRVPTCINAFIASFTFCVVKIQQCLKTVANKSKMIDNMTNYDVNQSHLNAVTVNMKTLDYKNCARVGKKVIYEFVPNPVLWSTILLFCSSTTHENLMLHYSCLFSFATVKFFVYQNEKKMNLWL